MNNGQFSLNVFLCHILKENQGKTNKSCCLTSHSLASALCWQTSMSNLCQYQQQSTPATTGEGCCHNTNTSISGLNQEKRKFHLLLQESEETLNLCTEAAPLLEPPPSFLCFPAPTQHLHPYQGWVTGSFQTTVPILSVPAQITVQGAQQQTACSVSCPSATTTTAAPASQAGTSSSGSSCWVLPRSSFGYHPAISATLYDHTLVHAAAKQTLYRTTSKTYRVF